MYSKYTLEALKNVYLLYKVFSKNVYLLYINWGTLTKKPITKKLTNIEVKLVFRLRCGSSKPLKHNVRLCNEFG